MGHIGARKKIKTLSNVQRPTADNADSASASATKRSRPEPASHQQNKQITFMNRTNQRNACNGNVFFSFSSCQRDWLIIIMGMAACS